MATSTLRAALAELLPAADSTANLQMADVIGNKDDTATGHSLVSILRRVESRLNNPSKVYPTLANGKVVTGAVGAWTLGEAAEIVPVDTITEDFLIYWVKVEDVSATDTYELVLYSGADADVEVGRFRTNKNTDFPEAGDVAISTEIIAANSKISAKCANSAGGSETMTISLHYVEIL
jgi:hypothetical protein